MTPEDIKKDWEVIEASKATGIKATASWLYLFDTAYERWPEALREVERLNKKYQDLVNAAEVMVKTLKQRSLDVEYTFEGELWGQKPQTLTKVSLLDNLHQALEQLKKEESLK